MTVYYVEHQEPEPVQPWRLWFSVSAPILIMALHILFGYALVSVNCYWQFLPPVIFGLSGGRVALLGLTFLLTVGVVVGGYIGFVDWRALEAAQREPERGARPDPTGRYRFMMYSGLLLNALVLIYFIWSIFTIFVTEVCPGV
jgi:hypothetical protein